jgi:pimeloyl-ACP methyl ester carboxylesterase
MEILAADIVAVLDDANIHKADFLGYSLAGRIGFGIAQYASKRFTSFMIGGAHPYLLDQNELDSNLQLFKQGIEAVIDVLEQSGMTLTPEARTQMLAEDAEAITALFSASHWRQSLDDALQTMTMPCLFFVGELDPLRSGVKQCADILPNATFICLPNCRHLGLMSQKGILLPHITHFLAKIS